MSKKKSRYISKPRPPARRSARAAVETKVAAPVEFTPQPVAPAPVDLPSDPQQFWHVGRPWETILPPTQLDAHPALKRLGPLPFPRTGFPLMGFLATLYEHVSTHAIDALRGADTPSAWPAQSIAPTKLDDQQ
jgi:hypothetical protein